MIYLRYKDGKMITIVGIICFLIASCNSYYNIKSFDSTSVEKDVLVLKEMSPNRKLIVQQCFNYKHNETQLDTVIVEDYYIFRKEL
jgi:hypothetical protein